MLCPHCAKNTIKSKPTDQPEWTGHILPEICYGCVSV